MAKSVKFFSRNTYYNPVFFLALGLGFGILIARPFIGDHPLRWGMGLVVLGLFGLVYPMMMDKK